MLKSLMTSADAARVGTLAVEIDLFGAVGGGGAHSGCGDAGTCDCDGEDDEHFGLDLYPDGDVAEFEDLLEENTPSS